MWRSFGLVLLGTGCAGEADYARVRQKCEDPILAWDPELRGREVTELIDARCAQALGDSIGLDWESFGFDAETLADSDPGAYVLTGLLTIAASDDGDLETIRSDVYLPLSAAEELERMEAAHHFDAKANSSEVWYAFVRQAIWSTKYAESVGEATAGISAAEYDGLEHTMYVSPYILDWWELGGAAPAFASAVLIHEAAHGWIQPHTWCAAPRDDIVCDPNPEGAFGVQVWWTSDWIQRYPQVLDEDICTQLENFNLGACMMHIEDYAGWVPCERACE